MSTMSNSSIAKRTRLQQHLLLQEWCSGSSSNQSRKRNREIGFSDSHEENFDDKAIDVDNYSSNKKKKEKIACKSGSCRTSNQAKLADDEEEETSNVNGSNRNFKGSSRLGKSLDQAIRIDDSDEDDQNYHEDGSGISFRSKKKLKKPIKSEEEENDGKESDGVEKIDDIKLPKIATESNDYGSSSSFKTGKHTYVIDLSDDSDSNDTIVIPNDIDDDDEDFQTFCKYHDQKQNDMKTCFYDQSTEDDYDEEDESSSSSESESENNLENRDFLLNKRRNQPTSNTDTDVHQSTEDDESSNSSESETDNSQDSDFHQSTENDESSSSTESETDNSEDSDLLPRVKKSNQPTNRKQSHMKNMKETSKKPTYCSSDSDTDGKMNAKHNANGVKNMEKKALSGSVNRKEKNHSVPKEIKMSKKPTYCSSDSDTDGKMYAKHNANGVKNMEEEALSGSGNRKEKNHSVPKEISKEMSKKPTYCSKEISKEMSKKPTYCSSDSDTDVEMNATDIANGVKNSTEKALSGSVNRKEKNHSVPKEIFKEMSKKPTYCSSGFDKNAKTNAKHNANGIKRVPREENGGFIDGILDSIIRNGSIHGKEGDDDDDDDKNHDVGLPLRFRFDDTEDESSSRETYDSDVQGLFREMNFELDCEEIGSYKTPMNVENRDKDDHNGKNNDHIKPNRFELCQRGEHVDIYFEEQTGMRCGLCGAVILESRFVMSKLANYAPDRSRRTYLSNEEEFSPENFYFKPSDWNQCEKTDGTFWELIPTRIRTHLYPHQQEGLKFLWENLAGTIEISKLQKVDLRKVGGGCIISHAPGTGKTLLTIVFIESFLKKFPKCCPVIVAPASMLLTWEAEFKKWQMGVSFINLNNSDNVLSNDIVNGDIKRNKDIIRAMKISSWSNGGSVLGVSYNLYEKLAGNAKNDNLEKMGNILLDLPGLVVLDEGHTPRNQNSNIWNALLKLKTKKRVILSGTPFQNNFRELFNTLRLVRPETAVGIENEKFFADMIQQKNGKKSGSRDIEKLKTIISPFVHVHKGRILESKLPGLKQSVILLNPPPFQRRFIENLGGLSKTLEYEHKVALVSVHPSLLVHCSLSEKEEKLTNKRQLKKVRLHPDLGVKTKFVMELIRLSISLNEKVLIFSQYIQPLELLKDQITRVFDWDDGREIMMIEGKINQKVRQTIINGFNDPNSKVKVLLASTKCCSEGIHLIGASRVVLLDVVWNPSVERQAISRAYRLGQKKMVYTYHLMAAGTTEEEKYDRQVAKGRLAELVFSSSSAMDGEKSGGMEVDDKILQEMVDHQQLKDMFKKIRYPEKET